MDVNLDRRIVIEQKVATQNADYGTEVISWVPLVITPIWAEMYDMPPSRSEAVKQGLATARDQTRIRIRYRQDVTAAMRITVGDRVMQIVAGPAEIGGRKKYLEMMCERYSS